MAKTAKTNDAQASLKLLGYLVGGLGALLVCARILMSSPILGSTFAVLAVAGVIGFNHWQQYRSKADQESLMMERRFFLAEVERAWEKSHPEEDDRRHRAPPQRAPPPQRTAAPPQRQPATKVEVQKVEDGKKKGKKKKGDAVVVDDEIEAEVVEDVEDFLMHSSLRGKIKDAAGHLRDGQKRQEEKKERKKEEAEAKLRPKVDPVIAKGLPPPQVGSSKDGEPIKGLPPPPTDKGKKEKVKEKLPYYKVDKKDEPLPPPKRLPVVRPPVVRNGSGQENADMSKDPAVRDPAGRVRITPVPATAASAQAGADHGIAGKGGASKGGASKGGASKGGLAEGVGAGAGGRGQGIKWDESEDAEWWASPTAWAGGPPSSWEEEAWAGKEAQWWSDDPSWGSGVDSAWWHQEDPIAGGRGKGSPKGSVGRDAALDKPATWDGEAASVGKGQSPALQSRNTEEETAEMEGVDAEVPVLRRGRGRGRGARGAGRAGAQDTSQAGEDGHGDADRSGAPDGQKWVLKSA